MAAKRAVALAILNTFSVNMNRKTFKPTRIARAAAKALPRLPSRKLMSR
jgi:hypothetical protein